MGTKDDVAVAQVAWLVELATLDALETEPDLYADLPRHSLSLTNVYPLDLPMVIMFCTNAGSTAPTERDVMSWIRNTLPGTEAEAVGRFAFTYETTWAEVVNVQSETDRG